MGAYDELIDEYLGTALSPDEMRDLALLQVKNASVQDDAVQNAVANHQGLERANRTALEEYLIAQEQQAAAESQKALEMAQQRLNALDQNATLLGSTVGLGKEGKKKLASIEAERQAILKAFPQLGAAGNGGTDPSESEAFDIAKMLSGKDYSAKAIKRMFDEGTAEDWDEAIRTGDLDLYQAMLDGKLGALPEGLAEKMRFVIGGKPETSKALKLNDKYARLRSVIGETQGDLKDAEKKAAAAAKKKDEEKLLNEKLSEYAILKDQYIKATNDFARKKIKNTSNFAEKMKFLAKHNKLSGEEKNKLVDFLDGEV